LRSNNTFLTLIASFCLSAVAYNAAQPVDAPVQHMEFDDYVIQPDMEVIEFGDYEIRIDVEKIEMDEMVIVANKGERDILDDPGAWCFIHPDDVICQDGEDQAGDDEEEGC
jgi:hypothetical protein